jgi:hypothetical protein
MLMQLGNAITIAEAVRAGFEVKGTIGPEIVLQKGKTVLICNIVQHNFTAPCQVIE